MLPAEALPGNSASYGVDLRLHAVRRSDGANGAAIATGQQSAGTLAQQWPWKPSQHVSIAALRSCGGTHEFSSEALRHLEKRVR